MDPPAHGSQLSRSSSPESMLDSSAVDPPSAADDRLPAAKLDSVPHVERPIDQLAVPLHATRQEESHDGSELVTVSHGKGRSRSRDRDNTRRSRDRQLQQFRDEHATRLMVPHRDDGRRRQVSPGLVKNMSRPKRHLSTESPDRDRKWKRLEDGED